MSEGLRPRPVGGSPNFRLYSEGGLISFSGGNSFDGFLSILWRRQINCIASEQGTVMIWAAKASGSKVGASFSVVLVVCSISV